MSVTLNLTADFKPLLNALNGATKQARFAASQALNDAAFKARTALQREMDVKFDRVTPYIKRSLWVETATPATLTAKVEPRYMGGKGVDPQKVLQAEVFGGARRQKASEKALQRVGILPAGYALVPGQACPLDQYGNIKGSFLVQIISYLQAFGEQGYRANATVKTIAKKAKFGRSAGGAKTINGVVYFVSYGKLRSIDSKRGSHYSPLAPGIWAKSGIHGSEVKPILMFVRNPTYKARFDFFGVATKAAQAAFPAAFETRMAAALRTARP